MSIRRPITLLFCGWWLLLFGGAVGWVHLQQHAYGHPVVAAHASGSSHAPHGPSDSDHHSESEPGDTPAGPSSHDCAICAHLQHVQVAPPPTAAATAPAAGPVATIDWPATICSAVADVRLPPGRGPPSAGA